MDKSGNIKLCDFGISGQLVDSIAKTRDAGCRPYMAVSIVKKCFCCVANDPPPPPPPCSLKFQCRILFQCEKQMCIKYFV